MNNRLEIRPKHGLSLACFFYANLYKICCTVILFFLINCVGAQVAKTQAIVVLRGVGGIEKLAGRSDIHIVRCLSKLYDIYLVEPRQPCHIEQFVKMLSKQPEVIIAQQNHIVFLREKIPNDTFFVNQWCLKNITNPGADIGVTTVWDSITGGVTKAGDTIAVGVVEKGLEMLHPDLQSNLYINHHEIPDDNMDNDSNGYIDDYKGYNTQLNNDSIPNSDHGTSVAGIIGASGDNKLGISGINWHIKILPVSFPEADEASVIEAYSYYAQMKKYYIDSKGKKGAYIVAVNSSFGVDNGNPSDYPIWCAMYDSLGRLGIISVGATANSAINTDVSYDMPTGCVSNFLLMVTNHQAIGGVDNSAAFGKRSIDIAAPGTDIYTTSSNANYSNNSGTSFAAPHVVGSIALLYSAACSSTINWTKEQPSQGALFFKSIILNGGKKESNFTNTTLCGGRLYLPNSFELLKTGFCAFDSFPLANVYCSQNQICPGEPTTLICLKRSDKQSTRWYVNDVFVSDSDTLVWQNDTPSFYHVKLVTGNGLYYDTIVLKNYLRVLNIPQKPSIQINGSILTTLAGGKMNWYDSAGSLLGAGVNFTPKKSGKYYCIFVNPDYCQSVSDTVIFYGVGIENALSSDLFEIYPNPAKHHFSITNRGVNSLYFEIIDPVGRIISVKMATVLGGSSKEIQLEQVPSGLYLIRVCDGMGRACICKLVKE